jgi:uncharacterized protein YcbK (DUF882 family)
MALAAAAFLAATGSTQTAIANGDTRSLTILHTHTGERATITFRRNGSYDEQGLEQLNWILRDWRTNEPTKMDPRLFDVVWEVYREAGSSAPVNIVSAYRSPATNGMLRKRSSGVSEHSQHMLGKAMDIRLPDVDTARLRAVAMRLQYGGVGYYSSSQFVHVDTGSVRAWPRMTQDQLARLFPNGKTVHLPSNGGPLPGYEEAKAEIIPRNAALAAQATSGGSSSGGLFASLFGRKNPAPAPAAPAPAPVPSSTPVQVAAVSETAAADEKVKLIAPLPPRRPLVEPIVVASADPTVTIMPPRRPLAPEPAAASPPASEIQQVEGSVWFDRKNATKALFDARTAVLAYSFSSEIRTDLTMGKFTGPAVKTVPVQQASL